MAFARGRGVVACITGAAALAACGRILGLTDPSVGDPFSRPDGATDAASDGPDAGEDDATPACVPDPAAYQLDASSPTLTTCGDASVALSGSPEHCGRCFRSCLGRRCVDGVCEALPIADFSTMGIDSTQISGNDSSRVLFFYASAHAYGWFGFDAGGFQLRNVDDAGGLSVPSSADPSPLYSDDDEMFARAYSGFFRIPLDGGAASWVDQGGGPGRMAVSTLAVYVTDDESGDVWRFPRGDGHRTSLQAGLTEPRDIVVSADDRTVYWLAGTAEPALWTAEGGSSRRLLSLGAAAQPVALALDRGELFWGDATNGTVWKLVRDGAPIQIARGDLTVVHHLRVDGNYVYWAAQDGANQNGIYRVARCGGATTIVSRGGSVLPVRFAVGPELVYFSKAASAEGWTSVK
jgi:hypothetical protein